MPVARPSMVVICFLPSVAILVVQDLCGLPSISTVQAPHWPSPQPYFVPVRSRCSRRTVNRVVLGLASSECERPFMKSWNEGIKETPRRNGPAARDLSLALMFNHITPSLFVAGGISEASKGREQLRSSAHRVIAALAQCGCRVRPSESRWHLPPGRPDAFRATGPWQQTEHRTR